MNSYGNGACYYKTITQVFKLFSNYIHWWYIFQWTYKYINRLIESAVAQTIDIQISEKWNNLLNLEYSVEEIIPKKKKPLIFLWFTRDFRATNKGWWLVSFVQFNNNFIEYYHWNRQRITSTWQCNGSWDKSLAILIKYFSIKIIWHVWQKKNTLR